MRPIRDGKSFMTMVEVRVAKLREKPSHDPDELAKPLFDIAKNMLAKHGQSPPTCMFYSCDDDGTWLHHIVDVSEFFVAETFAAADTKKGAYAAFVRKIARELRATAYMFSCETWHVQLEEGQKRSDLPDDLEKASQRREAVMVVVETHDTSAMMSHEIVRTSDGAFLTLAPGRKPTRTTGRMVGILADADSVAGVH